MFYSLAKEDLIFYKNALELMKDDINLLLEKVKGFTASSAEKNLHYI